MFLPEVRLVLRYIAQRKSHDYYSHSQVIVKFPRDNRAIRFNPHLVAKPRAIIIFHIEVGAYNGCRGHAVFVVNNDG